MIQPAGAGAMQSQRGRYDRIYRWMRDTADRPGWPRSTRSDADGRFLLRGVGRGQKVTLVVQHPRAALQTIEVETDAEAGEKLVAAGLLPVQFVNVRVTAADTGKPIAHVPLRVTVGHTNLGLYDEAETDAEGRARVNSWAAERWTAVEAYPPDGQPYLIARASVTWSKGLVDSRSTSHCRGESRFEAR